MATPNTTPKPKPTADDTAAAAKAAKAVGVDPSDILAFKDYGGHVVVVTRDGRKLDSREAESAEASGPAEGTGDAS